MTRCGRRAAQRKYQVRDSLSSQLNQAYGVGIMGEHYFSLHEEVRSDVQEELNNDVHEGRFILVRYINMYSEWGSRARIT